MELSAPHTWHVHIFHALLTLFPCTECSLAAVLSMTVSGLSQSSMLAVGFGDFLPSLLEDTL